MKHGNDLRPTYTTHPALEAEPIKPYDQQKANKATDEFFNLLMKQYGSNPQMLSKLMEYEDYDEETYNVGQDLYDQMQKKYGFDDNYMRDFWKNSFLKTLQKTGGK